MAFPSNPSDGDIFSRFNRQYTYNATIGKWSAVKATPVSTLASIESNIVPAENTNVDLGSADNRIRDIYLKSDSVINIGDRAVTSNSFLHYMTMVQSGTITAPFTGLARAYPPIDITISSMKASVGTTPSADLVFDLMKNGVSVQSFTIVAGEYTASQSGLTISVTTTDYLSINIVSGTGASDLKVDFTYSLT